jgi:hypothetical protein
MAEHVLSNEDALDFEWMVAKEAWAICQQRYWRSA